MPRPTTPGEILAIIERHVDEAHRHVLRSVTDPGRTLPRFKTRSEQAQEARAFKVLLAVLAEVHPATSDVDQLRQASYERIDGDVLAREDTLVRRRLQGIPEAPRSPG